MYVPFLSHAKIEVYVNAVAISNVASAAQVLNGAEKMRECLFREKK